MIRFLTEQILKTNSICNSEAIFKAHIVSRTEKTVTINMDGETKRCKVHTHENINNGNEFIYPLGRYSMCPVFKAG